MVSYYRSSNYAVFGVSPYFQSYHYCHALLKSTSSCSYSAMLTLSSRLHRQCSKLYSASSSLFNLCCPLSQRIDHCAHQVRCYCHFAPIPGLTLSPRYHRWPNPGHPYTFIGILQLESPKDSLSSLSATAPQSQRQPAPRHRFSVKLVAATQVLNASNQWMEQIGLAQAPACPPSTSTNASAEWQSELGFSVYRCF